MNGPVVSDFNADDDFQLYKKGILKQKKKAKEAYDPHSLSEKEVKVKMANQPLTHSVFILGWGVDEEDNIPYWIIRNSYGNNWGQNGDFHVRRG